jgi:hypothetical protein
MDPGTPKWPPEKENYGEPSCLEELGVLFGGSEASWTSNSVNTL